MTSSNNSSSNGDSPHPSNLQGILPSSSHGSSEQAVPYHSAAQEIAQNAHPSKKIKKDPQPSHGFLPPNASSAAPFPSVNNPNPNPKPNLNTNPNPDINLNADPNPSPKPSPNPNLDPSPNSNTDPNPNLIAVTSDGSSQPPIVVQKPVPSVAQNNWHDVLAAQKTDNPTIPNLQSSRQSAFHDPTQSSSSSEISRRLSVQSWGSKPLRIIDPHLWIIMEKEKQRQCKSLELIASENYASQAVIEALGCHLTNKYSEGIPGARLYCGNENIDLIEILCIERALKAFHLESNSWGVNVQPYSCTTANFAVYTALLQPKDRIMGLDSPSGGHLSHGYYTPSRKKVSAASIFFESFPYRVNSAGYIDFGDLERIALAYRPKLLICGASAYPREWDYAKFRIIADRCGAILMCDMAHISGIVAAQQCNSPFEYCDIVTSTTHKSLRGPRGGIIFYRKGPKRKTSADDTDQYDFEAKINFAVSHSIQGGPHNNRTAALAVAFLQVDTLEFKAYISQVLKNAKALAIALQKRDCKIVTGGTDNHLLLWDLRPFKLTGAQYEKVCEKCGITLNKNAVYGDNVGMAPGGVRIGTPAMTSRGCTEEEFETIAEFLMKAIQISQKVQKEHGNSQKAFLRGLQSNNEVDDLRVNVEKFSLSFEMPGLDNCT